MAVMTTPKSCKATLVTNKGSDPVSGSMIKGNVAISGLRATADNDKIYAVAQLLASCLAHQVITVLKTESVELSLE